MHVAVFGSGRMAQIRAPALATHPLVDRVTVIARNRAAGSDLASEVGGAWRDLSDPLEETIAAAVVCLPPHLHGENIRHCISQGVPVMCEKPLSASLVESRQLVLEADQADVALHVGFQRRFDPGMTALHERVRNGTVGQLYHLRISAHDAEPPDPAFTSTSGSMFRDMHVHDFDTIRWLTNEEIADVYAYADVRIGSQQSTGSEDLDVTVMIVTTESGMPAVITGSRHDPFGYDVRVEVLAAREVVGVGTATAAIPRTLDPNAPTFEYPSFGGFSDRFSEAFRQETAVFIDAVATGKPAPTPGSEAVAALEAAIAAEESWKTGRRVSLAEIAEED